MVEVAAERRCLGLVQQEQAIIFLQEGPIASKNVASCRGHRRHLFLSRKLAKASLELRLLAERDPFHLHLLVDEVEELVVGLRKVLLYRLRPSRWAVPAAAFKVNLNSFLLNLLILFDIKIVFVIFNVPF